MKVWVFALAFVCAASLFGQNRGHRFSWQTACFNNPGLPYCQGHDFAIKPVKGGKAGATGSNALGGSTPPDEDALPSVIVMGGVDWRFADPSANALVSISFTNLAPSPLAQFVMSALGASQGLKEADMEKIIHAFSGVGQVALSLRGDQILMMVTGCPLDATVPDLEAGWKAVTTATSMVIGTAAQVDLAIQRINKDDPQPELARSAVRRQANGDLWIAANGVAASGSAAGPDAVTAVAKKISFSASMRSRFTSESVFEFSQAPDRNAIETLVAGPGRVSVEGNAVRIKMSIEPDRIQQKVPDIAATPLGEYLGVLFKAARYIPVRDPAKLQPKPKIAGLDQN